MNPWIIDVDHIAEPGARPRTNMNAVGVRGPWNYEGDGSELTVRFRMFDDDKHLYYEGRSKEIGFEPLDDFGMPNAGCTYIEYLNNEGQWEII